MSQSRSANAFYSPPCALPLRTRSSLPTVSAATSRLKASPDARRCTSLRYCRWLFLNLPCSTVGQKKTRRRFSQMFADKDKRQNQTQIHAKDLEPFLSSFVFIREIRG